MDMVSGTRTTALSSNENLDDVIRLGSRSSTWSTSASTTNAFPRAAASATTRTSPLGHDSDDDVIFLYSRPVPKAAVRPDQHQRPRLQPNDKKQSLRKLPKKNKAKRKPSQRVPNGRRNARLEYAEVGWLASSGAQRQAVYGCLSRSGQLRYWSCSVQDDGGPITHREVIFCPELQGLSPDQIRKKLSRKMHRAARRNVRDES
ncbi:hypothetical protein BDP55DRAFT_687545 [Colletotrichum godetiae]|uniref:Uncharacterized protein n=1 Tax=Colletotrichum godetiae TaxID=1209918 RepID=A0AAJ0ELZ2_9PEZI|nr:uncharacterized protein BDP55DRAFT_687545 [Colletotrichum godetiae]KAK1656881.1 hypothetical protein BDP55DRAFT_687545 [Colletotrichum godetiae]